jgi:hypothetical protein
VDRVTWPAVELDRVAQLRVLSRALSGVALAERTIAAPFDVVWGFVADLPNSVPQFDRDVASIEIVERDGERLKVVSRPPLLPIPFRLDVELREGWCWMVAHPQLYVVGMAAVPAGEHTRFAMLEGVSFAGPSALRSMLAPVSAISRWRHRRHLPHDLDGIERALGLRPTPGERDV